MNTLSPEQIAYVDEWLRSGNEWRKIPPIDDSVLQQMSHTNPEASDFYRLNPAGCTIAKMAIALEQMSVIAQDLWDTPSSEHNVADMERLEDAMLKKTELLG